MKSNGRKSKYEPYKRTALGSLALLFLLISGSAGSASNRTYTEGDLILAPDKIYLAIWAEPDVSGKCITNVTLLEENYTLSLDRVYYISIPAKDDMWSREIRIANFTLNKNGEAVKKINVTDGDFFYYNKTLNGKEYTIIEFKVDGIFNADGICGGFLVRLQPFYQYSDGAGDSKPEIAVSPVSVPPSEEWNRTFGGTGFDSANAVQQTFDGGYVLAGQTYVSDGDAVWLIKTDANGNQQWNKTFGGRKTGVDSANSVQQTRDGGYIIAGGQDSSPINHSSKAWLIKTDANGNLQWDKTFKGEESWAFSVQQTRDGGYIIAGAYNSYLGGAWLIKTDSNGTEQWNRIFRGQFLSARSVQQTSDGGYIIVGRIYRDIGNDTFNYAAWLVRIDANGNRRWEKTFGSLNGAFNSLELSDGGYIIAGWTKWDGAWLVKTDANGSLQWSKTFGGNSSANAVKQTSDGGYVLAGITGSYDTGDTDAWLIKVSGESIGTAKTPKASPTETLAASSTQAPTAVPTGTLKLNPTEKAPGFEVVMAIATLLAVCTAWRGRCK